MLPTTFFTILTPVVVIDAQTHASTGTKSRAVRRIRRMVEDEHGPGTVPMPSNATFYRLLDMLSAGRHTFGSAYFQIYSADLPVLVTTDSIPSSETG